MKLETLNILYKFLITTSKNFKCYTSQYNSLSNIIIDEYASWNDRKVTHSKNNPYFKLLIKGRIIGGYDPLKI
ncbi:hypothetical protein Glove_386g26 [Diversispora epigaea]|uniref:Uncharacterized protein n=1 Tax=Diversispora epigaea TaxID=1348612 RepID=A0A397H7C6_9GLOM|nr:hypothetical protein Glove_386g26 [Diversispora epigaea]